MATDSVDTVSRIDREALAKAGDAAWDMSDDDLLEAAAAMAEDARFFANLSRTLDTEVASRMAEREANLLIGGKWIAEREQKRVHVWNVPLLEERLKPLMGPVWDSLVTTEIPAPVTKVSTVKLAALAKRLGPAVEAAVEECRTVNETPGKVTYKPIKGEDE